MEALQEWNEVAAEVMGPSQGMLGSAQLNWPDDKDRRLGGQVLLLRELADERIQVEGFSMTYFYTGENHFDTMVGDMSSHLFDPHAEELRHRLQDVVELSLEDEVLVPAAGRIVPLDHTAQAFEDAVRAVERTLDEVERSNSIESDDKKRVTLELSAGLDLLRAPKTRIVAAGSLLLGACLGLSSNSVGPCWPSGRSGGPLVRTLLGG